jgi:hypothetical protein
MIVSDWLGKDVGGGGHSVEVLRKGMKTRPAVTIFESYFYPQSTSVTHPTLLALAAELLFSAVKIRFGSLLKEELLRSSELETGMLIH